MSRIYPLPSDVIHLIAAGEVIDSLAAVVRELIENAIDAGASRIAIALWPDQWRVRVADNGGGMDLENLQQAASPHSTSKINHRDDLWRITSLGFRGEALHSLAQLAHLQICSRAIEAEIGWQVSYDAQGQPTQVETVAIAPGTIVTASDLFGIWPGRRQGLPTPAQQMRAVQLVIQQIALCHPTITWQVEQNDRPWFTLWPGTSIRDILPQILREVQASDLQELTLAVPCPIAELEPNESTDARINVVLGLPDRCHRHRPDWIRVAINGRILKAPDLEQRILSAFRRTLPRDRYPICVVHWQLPADQIDWNRHPAKAEVYLRHFHHWQEQMAAAIDQALHLNAGVTHELPLSDRVGQLLKTAELNGAYRLDRSIPVASTADPSFANLVPNHELRAVAQIHQTYILAEHPAGLWLVEQHIAHERVLYEQLAANWQLRALETPVILNHLSTKQLEQLQRLGLEVDPFGEQLWAVRQAPALLAQRSDCAAALLELSLGGDLEAAIVATACRSAIRNGTPLTLPEMQTLLNQWQQTRHPRTCPHGRPIYLPLEETVLSRFFRRHWVIGKSHGLKP